MEKLSKTTKKKQPYRTLGPQIDNLKIYGSFRRKEGKNENMIDFTRFLEKSRNKQ